MLPVPTADSPIGDWPFYKHRMDWMRRDVIPERCSTLQASMQECGAYWMKQYLGPNRGMTKEPRILTPEFVEKLAADNQRRREERSAKVNQEGDKNEVFPVDR